MRLPVVRLRVEEKRLALGHLVARAVGDDHERARRDLRFVGQDAVLGIYDAAPSPKSDMPK
jgi:hypothetical protein